MRAFAACLTVFLGFGAASMAACSSDSTTGGAAGAAGEAGDTSSGGSTAGTGGGPVAEAGSAGIGDSAGAAGAAGAPACAFESTKCQACVESKCLDEATACNDDATCSGPLSKLPGCACDPSKTTLECETAFQSGGGDKATILLTCFNNNCATDCQ